VPEYSYATYFIIDSRAVEEKLHEIGQKLAETEPLMQTIANVLYSGTVRHFEEEAFNGTKWPPLSEATAEAKITKTRRRGYENILRPTGRHIFQRIHQRHNNDEARVTCTQWWAWVHQLGARVGKAQIPARPFLGIDEQTRNDIDKSLDAWIDWAVKD